MAIGLEEKSGGKTLEVALMGTLVGEDYELLVPAVKGLVERHGKIRMLVVMHDFHGWTPGGLWVDTKFAAQPFGEIEKLAVVGETRWQKGMTAFCKPFTTAEVRYFDYPGLDKARAWLAAE